MPIKRFRFKKLFVALSLFFVLIPSYGRGWHFLQKNEKDSSFYQIMPSNQDSQYLKVWWWVILRDKMEGMDNAKTLHEVDCKNLCLRSLYGFYYNEAEFISEYPINEAWHPATPDSFDDEFIQTVCNKPYNDLLEPVEVDIKKELSSLRGNEDESAIEESLAKGKWFLAYTGDEDNLVLIKFFDKASLRINKQYRQLLNWSLWTNPSSVTPLAIVSSLGFLLEYDCDKQRCRMLKSFSLNKTSQVISQPRVSKWLPYNRSFPDIDWVCDNKNKLTATPVTVDFRTIETIPEEWLVGIDE